MNILMLTPDYPPNAFGGIGLHVYALTQELTKLGHSVTVICLNTHIFTSNEYTIETGHNTKIIRFINDKNKQAINSIY